MAQALIGIITGLLIIGLLGGFVVVGALLKALFC